MARQPLFRIWLLMAVVVLSVIHLAANANPIIYTGPPITFSKAAFADPTDPANQDQITPAVALTRGNTAGLYNAVSETQYDRAGRTSPLDTEWAWSINNTGQTIEASNFPNLTFDTWVNAHMFNPPGTVGIPGVLHLISEDIYIDIMFTSWGIGIGGGGAFSYERTTAPEPSSNTDFDSDGDTDGADFILWQRGYDPSCTTCTLSDGDSDGDNDVDEVDLANWEANYGMDAPLAAAATVPEPSTWIMLMLGMAAMLTGHRTAVSKPIR